MGLILDDQALIKCFEKKQALLKAWVHHQILYKKLDRLKSYNYELISSSIDAKTEVERKRKTLTSKEYKAVLDELNKAEANYIRINSEIDLIDMEWDTLRSTLSRNKKTEANTL